MGNFDGFNYFIGNCSCCCCCCCIDGFCIDTIYNSDRRYNFITIGKKCQEIANEGYKIHTLYPTSNPDELLEADMKRLLYLDNLWIKECVSILPAESIINIINNVERDFSFGE